MEVVLTADVDKLGSRGEVVRVAPGYARNFLFPRSLARPASPGAIRDLREEDRVMAKRDAKRRTTAEGLASRMTDLSCTLTVKADEEQKLYGSVTAQDVVRALEAQGHAVERRQVHLEEEPIKKLGVYNGKIELHREVQVPIKIWVVAE
jgi:large subunit ribosomal protein L9